jgi:hypothetical protein
MTFLLVLILLVLVAVAAPRYGADSRHLDRDEAARDALWSRGPSDHSGQS